MEAGNNQRKWLVFIISGLSNLVATFSINSFALALPILEKEFEVSQSTVSWLSMVYSLIPCCTFLILGRTAELYGFKRQLRIGFLYFGAVCLLAPLLANTIEALIFFRCLQGLGFGITGSITFAVVSRTFPAAERGKAIGISAALVSIGLASGPTIGGFLLTSFSWRALFYFNVPFCLIGYYATCRILPEDPAGTAHRERMDVAGALLWAFSLGAFVIGLSYLGEWGLLSVPFLSCILACVSGILLFIKRELGTAAPLMDLRLFKNRTFTQANAVCMLFNLVQQMSTYLLPFYMINFLHLPSSQAGLIMLASPLCMLIFSPIGGNMADKNGTRLPSVLGIVLLCASCLIFSLLRETAAAVAAIAVLALAGAGNGLSMSPLNAAIITSASIERAGIASGMLTTMRTLGQTLGVVFGSLILTVRGSVYRDILPQQAYLLAQRDALYFCMSVLLVSLVLVLLLPKASVRK